MKNKNLIIAIIILGIPFVLTKILDEKLLNFWGSYSGAVATIFVIFFDKYLKKKDEKNEEIKIIQLILQHIYLEYENIKEQYEILMLQYSQSQINEKIFRREVDLDYIRNMILGTNDYFMSMVSVYLISIEKELCNIKTLEKARENPKSLYRKFDVEKRLIPVEKLVKKMCNYDNDPKSSKTVNSYCEYYQKILREYENEVNNFLKI